MLAPSLRTSRSSAQISEIWPHYLSAVPSDPSTNRVFLLSSRVVLSCRVGFGMGGTIWDLDTPAFDVPSPQPMPLTATATDPDFPCFASCGIRSFLPFQCRLTSSFPFHHLLCDFPAHSMLEVYCWWVPTARLPCSTLICWCMPSLPAPWLVWIIGWTLCCVHAEVHRRCRTGSTLRFFRPNLRILTVI